VAVGKAGQIAGGVVAAVLLALVLAQILMPKIAASSISSKLGHYGRVQDVSVSAWPAVKLLWGSADSVKVRMRSLDVSTHQAANLVSEGHGAAELQLTATSAKVGPLAVQRVALGKHGDKLTAAADASAAAVDAALAPGVSVALVRSEGGSVVVRASGGLFGVSASIDAVAGPQEGRLVARPLGLLLSGFQLTLFADPHVYVEGVGASPLAGEAGGYSLQMNARLR
jgi:hypothetical protein